MKFQIYLFIFATLFTVAVADTLLRAQKQYTKEQINHFREMIEAHRKKIKQNKEKSGQNEAKQWSPNGIKAVAKRDTLLKALPVKHREDKYKAIVTFKDTLLKSGQAADHPVKHRNDRRKAIIVFKDTLLKSGQDADEPVKHREDRKTMYITFKDTLLKSGEVQKKVVKRDTLLKALPTGDKRAPQQNALMDALRKRYNHQKGIAKRDTLLKSLNKDIIVDGNQDKATLAARRREAIVNFLKNRRNQISVSQRDTLLSIAATVVGAAVSSVVSNLMKNVEESVVKAENEAKKLQADVLDSDQGAILGQGEFAPISSDVHDQKKPAAPKSNDLVPKPFAPVHADVEVIVGNTSTSTTAPAADKKGFFATLFNSFKLLFGTVTNSVGGFFIDVGSRITNFVEKRIKV
ncbi:hypothetical protein CAEBREN_21903 [Caenorhabditis brenneri]|uniref:SXP/RAL-2 family protein Ani s 5-like cation-binding domain-containing protein n=1 Tax=Caenorhabditis brenneri TaxID=135651 RepID=G0NAH6_CAEBE|nr:hypothetical protein CAEBREN_21903 [Caenorhabditis brenneri]